MQQLTYLRPLVAGALAVLLLVLTLSSTCSPNWHNPAHYHQEVYLNFFYINGTTFFFDPTSMIFNASIIHPGPPPHGFRHLSATWQPVALEPWQRRVCFHDTCCVLHIEARHPFEVLFILWIHEPDVTLYQTDDLHPQTCAAIHWCFWQDGHTCQCAVP